jgi:DNA-directed RNA polymerase specialized sigma24 family protein
MAKRISGAGVNRSAARKAAAVAALRRAQREEHEQSVTAAVGLYFDRTGRAGVVLAEARVRADRILADGEQAAAALNAQADGAVARLRTLGEKPVEIAGMLDLPVSGVRAALARAGGNSSTREVVVLASGSEPEEQQHAGALVAADVSVVT